MSSMSLESAAEGQVPAGAGSERRLLDDPVSIRALAHPIRLELLAMVGRAGRMTAAEAARRLSISQGLATHHLRQLAKYGFVEQVHGDDNRERPWRPVSTSLGVPEQPSSWSVASAGAVLEQVTAERGFAQFLDWQRRRADWGEDWEAVSGVHLASGSLTREELGELGERMRALLGEYVDRSAADEGGSGRGGAVPVDVTVVVVPLGDPPADRMAVDPGRAG